MAYPLVSIIALVSIEAIMVAGLWMIHRTSDDDVFGNTSDEISREKTTVRFGGPGDDWGTERVYDEWFSSKLSIDDEDYCKIMARCKFVRVAEVTIVKAAEKSVCIAGYYAVFPIATATFSALCDGSLKERDLTSSMILNPDDSRAGVLYVCEIVSSRKCDVRIALIGDLKSYVMDILTKNVNISKIGTWPYTKYGKKIVKNLDMQPVGRWSLLGKMYQLPRSKLAGFRARPFKPTHTTYY